MKQVSFSNFIAFGKRMSIDIRVISSFDVNGQAIGIPTQFTISDEIPNTGDSDGIHISFNEMAERLIHDLVLQLNSRGLTALGIELTKRFRNSVEFADGYLESFAGIIALIYELNNETFRVEE
ncbi:hypothetical protein QIJ71_gp1 [ssRNA phage Gerhypos.3_17]|jgi:hypothetical protein|uniref:Uncharacterized protein n=2 Tax=Fiersviridae TaxID=2842319 RepID=A0A8S5KZ65_9VIRU|nr:hypothetical protein QIJ71_gp1 [ssRNA phage Gerhypos.3_17]DAD50138.1 TPA_asm: hypothetical protein [ssRNA phage Gerhypos.3_17]